MNSCWSRMQSHSSSIFFSIAHPPQQWFNPVGKTHVAAFNFHIPTFSNISVGGSGYSAPSRFPERLPTQPVGRATTAFANCPEFGVWMFRPISGDNSSVRLSVRSHTSMPHNPLQFAGMSNKMERSILVLFFCYMSMLLHIAWIISYCWYPYRLYCRSVNIGIRVRMIALLLLFCLRKRK